MNSDDYEADLLDDLVANRCWRLVEDNPVKPDKIKKLQAMLDDAIQNLVVAQVIEAYKLGYEFGRSYTEAHGQA